MNTMPAATGCALLVLLATAGCGVSTPQRVADAGPGDALLCAIASVPAQYEGAEVELAARYVTDNAHEEVLRNHRCAEGMRILDIGRHGGSDSVRRFYADQKRICLKRGARSLCNTSADVRMRGRIRLDKDRTLFDLEEVRSFVFDE
ncbi:hypothetical protein [Stenotrophomonas sp. C1657]|uniref:hypothetical protein n=1 Tax=Stenotrophomonas sp. C1657 TaxID=3077844 RepID=UPI00293D0B6C|nr:hypothetical protein [Stenotrophomonas sp. C1657]MDV3514581.1 hypothetical protein [Stenotrophomonas sp. C1657]